MIGGQGVEVSKTLFYCTQSIYNLTFFDHFFGERKCRLPQSGRRTAKKKMHKTIPFCISYHKY